MQLNITLKKMLGLFFGFLIAVFSLVGLSANQVNAQTTLTTNHVFNNSNNLVTFNFTNNNATDVVITNISSVINLLSGDANTTVFYKPGAISGPPGPISVANGWTRFGTALVTSNGLGTVQPIVPASLIVPANTTYGIAVQAVNAVSPATAGALGYSTLAAGTYTFTGGGAVLTTGTNVSYGGGTAPAAPTFTPRGFIGSVSFETASGCVGTPAPGNTISSQSPVCPGTNFSLTLQNRTPGTGVTYQWQSASSLTGPYVSVAAPDTFQNYVVRNFSATTFYRAVVTCGGNSVTSTPVQVDLNVPLQCYCIPGASSCAADDVITNVTIQGINNNSGCSTGPPAGYTNFTALTPGTIVQGANNPISVTATNGGTEYAAVWLDYNRNGVFDPSEFTAIGIGPGGTFTNNMVVPANASLGNTRMRVRLRFGTALTAGDACIGYGFGETEDYTVNIVPCVPIAFTSQPTNRSTVCGGNASFTVGVTGSLPAYQWQYRVNSTSPWLVVPNAAPYSGTNTATLTISSVDPTLNGYQYRAVVSGGCTGADFSSTATLTITPVTAVVTPVSAVICNGSIQQLSLTNTVSAPVTSTFSSTAVPVSIPDGSPLPLVSTPVPMTVSGIPAGSVITNIGVRFTMTHTYVGDIIMNLKAPNGQQLSLINQLNGGAGNNSTDDFTNTVIDSTATVSISGAAAPRTGTYRAEKFLITNPLFGDLQTSNVTWAGLLSTLNGTWSLQIADPGPGDVGNVTAAEIFFTYAAPVFAQGTWSGPAGTIFTNAAATTAYTGTPANTVFVKPTANGVNNYTVNFVAGACTSSTATIPVTVRQLPTSLGAVANQTVCEASNATFTSAVVGGSGSILQWQLSTNNGVTFTNIANGGVYSGATTNTLTITGAPVSLSGYRYRLSATSAPCTGDVTSTAGTLTVNPKPVVTISVAPVRNLFPGLTTTLTAAVSPNPTGAAYQWFKNGTAVAGATVNTLVVNVDNLGTYSIRVIDANGCVAAAGTSTPANIVIGDSANFSRLFIYPSPNNGRFQVRYFNDVTNGGMIPAVLNVYDSKGTRVFSRNYTVGGGYQAMNIDLGASHGSGVYRVDLLTTTGERIKTGSVFIF